VCKSCGGLEILACDWNGAGLCRLPYVLAWGEAKCQTVDECVADTPVSIPRFAPGWWDSSVQYGSCSRCGEGAVRTPDKLGCAVAT